MTTRFEFAFAAAYRLPALAFGVRPASAFVTVTGEELRVHFGLWRLVTALDNIAGTEVTGDFAWLKTAGPPHLSFADRGVTFATNGDRALCVQFVRPVSAIDPTGILKHPAATLTVAEPEALRDVLS